VRLYAIDVNVEPHAGKTSLLIQAAMLFIFFQKTKGAVAMANARHNLSKIPSCRCVHFPELLLLLSWSQLIPLK
jgi:hypothetical protein